MSQTQLAPIELLEIRLAATQKVASDAILACMVAATTGQQMLDILDSNASAEAYRGVLETLVEQLRKAAAHPST